MNDHFNIWIKVGKRPDAVDKMIEIKENIHLIVKILECNGNELEEDF